MLKYRFRGRAFAADEIGERISTVRLSRQPVNSHLKRHRDRGEINLAVKRPKPNNVGPVLSVLKNQNDGSPMNEDRKPTVQEARKFLQNLSSSPDSSKPRFPKSYIPMKQQTKLKAISRQSNPDTKLEGVLWVRK